MQNINEYLFQIQKIEFYKHLSPIFSKLNINYAIIKGDALSIQAFGKPGIRDYSDIDILISRENLKKIENELAKNNFKNYNQKRNDRIIMLSNSHQVFPWVKDIKPWGEITVDLNFDIFWGEYTGERIKMSDFLSDVTEIDIYGVKVKTLPIIKSMIQLILHHYKEMNSIYLISKHDSINYNMFKDIYNLWRNNRDEIPIEKLLEISEQYKISEYVYYLLYYTNVIFNDSILEKYVDAFESEEGKSLLNCYGLSDKERKVWTVDFKTRLSTENLYSIIKNDLTEVDFQKLEINKKIFG